MSDTALSRLSSLDPELVIKADEVVAFIERHNLPTLDRNGATRFDCDEFSFHRLLVGHDKPGRYVFRLPPVEVTFTTANGHTYCLPRRYVNPDELLRRCLDAARTVTRERRDKATSSASLQAAGGRRAGSAA